MTSPGLEEYGCDKTVKKRFRRNEMGVCREGSEGETWMPAVLKNKKKKKKQKLLFLSLRSFNNYISLLYF